MQAEHERPVLPSGASSRLSGVRCGGSAVGVCDARLSLTEHAVVDRTTGRALLDVGAHVVTNFRAELLCSVGRAQDLQPFMTDVRDAVCDGRDPGCGAAGASCPRPWPMFRRGLPHSPSRSRRASGNPHPVYSSPGLLERGADSPLLAQTARRPVRRRQARRRRSARAGDLIAVTFCPPPDERT